VQLVSDDEKSEPVTATVEPLAAEVGLNVTDGSTTPFTVNEAEAESPAGVPVKVTE
jgi:hypothetical protein